MSDSRQVHELARQIEELRQLVMQRGPQLGSSSIESGSIGEYDSNGQLVARYGRQWDGSHIAASLSGGTPPAPTGVSGTPVPVGIKAAWAGTFTPWTNPATGFSTDIAPSDFTRVEVHVSTDPNLEGFGILFSTYRKSIESPRGGEVDLIGLESDTDYYLRFTARTQSGKFSAPSEVVGPIRTGKIEPEDLTIDLSTIGGNTIHRQSSPPVGTHKIGDLWLDSDTNIPHRWEGDPASWVESRDTGIAGAINTAFAAQTAADSKARIFPQASAPTGLAAGDVGDMWLDTDDGNRQYTWDGDSWETRLLGNSAIQPNSLVASDVIATGTVTAALLEAVVVLASTIIGGDPVGDHASLSELGLRIFSVDPDGIVVESGSFGGTGTDRFLIIDPATGNTLAAIGPSGASFPTVTTDSLVVGGNTLDYLFDRSPRGLIARGGANTGFGNTTSVSGTYDVEFLAEPGRAYSIETTGLNLNPSTTTTYVYAALVARKSADGPTLTSSGIIEAQRGSTNIAGGIVPITLSRTVSFTEIFEAIGVAVPTVPTLVRIGLVYGIISGGGTVSIFGNVQYPVHTYIYDVGVERPFTGVLNLGGGTAPAMITQRQTDFAATWGANWIGSSNSPRTGSSDLIQGYTPYYPAGGSGIGQIGFGNFAATLSGSTIHWAALYVYTPHWHYDSGGTIMLGAHAYASPPATKPADWQLDATRSGGHPKGGGGWIYLPSSWFGGLASGATKGFTFGNGTTTDPIFYGRIVAALSDNRRPVLRVNYSK